MTDKIHIQKKEFKCIFKKAELISKTQNKFSTYQFDF